MEQESAGTLYDWLVQIKGMREGIAVDIDDRIPEIDDMPTPQTLWQYAGIMAHADERDGEPGDPGLMLSLYDFVDGLRAMIETGEAEGSVYAKIYQEQAARSAAKVADDPRYRGPRAKANAVHGRARRTAAQVLLGHIWEVCYRLDNDKEPVVRFSKPIPPEVPFPEVGIRV